MSSERNLEIANNIRQQIGVMAMMMMGVPKNGLVAVEKGLRIAIRGSEKCNRITITLADNDTYTVRFHRFRRGSLNKKTLEMRPDTDKTTAEQEEIYVDMLMPLIRENTGLHTNL